MNPRTLLLQFVSTNFPLTLTRQHISDEVVFKALTGINWATSDFQPMGEEEEDEPVQDDPESSTRQGQD